IPRRRAFDPADRGHYLATARVAGPRRGAFGMMASSTTKWLVGALVVVLVAGLLFGPLLLARYGTYILSMWVVMTIAAIGLNLTLGYAGQISLAQGAFVGIGAYAAALLTAKGWPLGFAYILAGVSCFGIGWLLGYPAL